MALPSTRYQHSSKLCGLLPQGCRQRHLTICISITRFEGLCAVPACQETSATHERGVWKHDDARALETSVFDLAQATSRASRKFSDPHIAIEDRLFLATHEERPAVLLRLDRIPITFSSLKTSWGILLHQQTQICTTIDSQSPQMTIMLA